MATKVELYWWEGCPSWHDALTLVRDAMSDAGLDPDQLEVVRIETEDDAEREGFIGSPTIRVDGHDVQPPADPEPPGLTCRVYRLRDGRTSPLPDPADVREALAA